MTQKLLDGNLLSVIRSYYPSLTKSEQKVADMVLEDIESVLYCSVTDLADKAGGRRNNRFALLSQARVQRVSGIQIDTSENTLERF